MRSASDTCLRIPRHEKSKRGGRTANKSVILRRRFLLPFACFCFLYADAQTAKP